MSHLSYLDVRALAPSPALLGLLSRQVLMKYRMLPLALLRPGRALKLPPNVAVAFHRSGDLEEQLVVGMVSPEDPVAQSILAGQLRYTLVGVALDPRAFDQFAAQHLP